MHDTSTAGAVLAIDVRAVVNDRSSGEPSSIYDGGGDGDRRPATGDRRPATGDRRPATGDRRPATGDRRPATGDRRPATGDRRPATGDRRPATGDSDSDSSLEGMQVLLSCLCVCCFCTGARARILLRTKKVYMM